MGSPQGPDFEALVDAVVRRLQSGFGGGFPIAVPAGEPTPGRPQLPWDPLDEGPLPLLRRRALRIAGMELTQSIQHHGAAGESFGPDNSVPLVALKTLVVRVYPYVRPGLAWPDTLSGQRVTGELVLSVGHHIVYRTAPMRPEGVRVGPLSQLSRTLAEGDFVAASPGPGGMAVGLRNGSLDFRVPAHHCRRGQMHVAVRIWRVDVGPLPSAQDSATVSQHVEFLDVPAPRIALVRVAWDDGRGTVTTPSDAEMLRTLRLGGRMLPFPYFEARILPIVLASSGAFARSVPGGGCNEAWKGLNARLLRVRVWTMLLQPPTDIFFGMVPRAAIPGRGSLLVQSGSSWQPGPGSLPAQTGRSSINSGCGKAAGVGGCFIDEEPTFAHELGHIYGCRHVAVPGDTTNDPDYPNYGGSTTSIGEVGIDTGSSPPVLHAPLTTSDIMSYKSPQWISPYTYRRILDARDMHWSAPADPRRVRPVLLAEVRVHRTERGLSDVKVQQAFRLEVPGVLPVGGEGATSPLSIDLLDADRRILATHHCLYVRPQPSGCGCAGPSLVPLEREPYIDLLEVIEWPGEHVTALSFHRGEASLATVEVGEPPRVEIEGPERRQDMLVVRVRATHPRETPAVAILFSGDDGLTWQPVGFDHSLASCPSRRRACRAASGAAFARSRGPSCSRR